MKGGQCELPGLPFGRKPKESSNIGFDDPLSKQRCGAGGALGWLGMGRTPKKRRNDYGAWLHLLRQERDLTQEEVAKQCEIPRTTLMHWERTGKLTGRKEILRLVAVLGVSLNELLRPDKRRPK